MQQERQLTALRQLASNNCEALCGAAVGNVRCSVGMKGVQVQSTQVLRSVKVRLTFSLRNRILAAAGARSVDRHDNDVRNHWSATEVVRLRHWRKAEMQGRSGR